MILVVNPEPWIQIQRAGGCSPLPNTGNERFRPIPKKCSGPSARSSSRDWWCPQRPVSSAFCEAWTTGICKGLPKRPLNRQITRGFFRLHHPSPLHVGLVTAKRKAIHFTLTPPGRRLRLCPEGHPFLWVVAMLQKISILHREWMNGCRKLVTKRTGATLPQQEKVSKYIWIITSYHFPQYEILPRGPMVSSSSTATRLSVFTTSKSKVIQPSQGPTRPMTWAPGVHVNAQMSRLPKRWLQIQLA